MSQDLASRFQIHRPLTKNSEEFLVRLEKEIAQDLWGSAGGFWSEDSIRFFRGTAMEKLAAAINTESPEEYQKVWGEIVRDFHKNYWGQQRLLKKEKKEKTAEQKIFWELFSYIWILLQAMLIVKTVVFYLGIKSANEDTTEGKIYVISAILFSFTSLIFFAYRKSKKENKEESQEK